MPLHGHCVWRVGSGATRGVRPGAGWVSRGPQGRQKGRGSTPDPFSPTVPVMPANLSPEYKAAEASFRKTRDPRQRLEWLREMLRTIPKHKGTEHLQADIKARVKDLAEEMEGEKKGR